MKPQEKKALLDASNYAINIALDAEPLPSCVLDYAKKVIFEKDHFGWFKAATGRNIGNFDIYCCACQTNYECATSYPLRHISKHTCSCGAEIEIRKHGRSDHLYKWQKNNICFLQKFGDFVVVRYFQNTRHYTDKDYVLDTTAALRKNEYQRIIFRPEGVRRFQRNYWFRAGWSLLKTVDDDYGADHLQTKTELRQIFENTYLKNSPWFDCDSESIYTLYKFATWPTLEYLQKLGYKTLVDEIMRGRTAEDRTLNLYKKKCNEVLGVPHSILIKYGHASLRERDIKAIKQFIQFGRLGQLTLERFEFIQSVLTNNSLDPLDVFRSFGLEKVLNYLDKQVTLASEEVDNMCHRGHAQAISKPTVWRDFQDYRRECHELGYDITDELMLFPRDLCVAHRQTSELVERKREREKQEKDKKKAAELTTKYLAVVKKYLKKQFTDDKFILRVATSPLEIIEDGKKLLLCTRYGGYAERVVQKNSLMFFIRAASNPDKPLYTVELNYKTKSIVQCRGYDNKNAPTEVFDFIKQALPRLAKAPEHTQAAS